MTKLLKAYWNNELSINTECDLILAFCGLTWLTLWLLGL